MVRKKSGSRRQSLKDKYKIEKKCKEHKRKLRKEARLKGPSKGPKKDPGIPNLWPFKDALVAKIARDREAAEGQKLKQKNERHGMLMRLKRAQDPVEDEMKKDGMETEGEQDYAKRRWYFKEMKKVIEMSDIILEVFDARDPMGCRCLEIERRVQQMALEGRRKRIIIVLNKIDLVPQEIVTKWLKHLRREFPTVAFKASTQQQGNRLSVAPVKLAKASDELLNSAKCVGASALMQLLKNYCRNQDIKTALNVGIIGYPNVGKSSIINSLKRSRVAGVGATPGFTKTISAIRLDKYINMLDSPGVLFSSSCSQSDLVLRNCIKLEQCEDPVAAVHAIAERCPQEQLLQLYKISEYASADEFVAHVAHKRGKIKKGGVPNLVAAARTILKDWTTGFIPFYTLPPALSTADKHHESKTIVATWDKEFDLDSIDQSQVTMLSAPSTLTGGGGFVQMKSSAPLTMVEDVDGDDEDEEEMDGEEEDAGMNDEEDEETSQVRLNIKSDKKKVEAKPQAHPLQNQDQQNRFKKKELKKAEKQKRREAGQHSTEGDAGMSDNYDFASF